MASNENQDKLQVTIEPVLDPNAATNVTEELKQRVTSGQAYIDEMKQYYTDKAGGTSAYDIFIAPLEKFSTELISIADSLNKGLDTSKLGVLQQKLTGISRMVGELDEVKGKQTAAASLIDKNTMSALSQFTAELQRVMPNARTIDSIMGSDLGKRMMNIVSGGKATTAQDYGTVKRYLTMAMPSLHPVSGFRDESQKNIHNVSDYLPMMFMSAQMDTGSLQDSFSNVTKKAIAANLKEQIAAITTIPEANRTKEQTAVLKQLTHQNQFTTKANHNPVLNAEFTKEIIREFENNNRFAKVLIDTGIAAKGTDEGTYQLPAQFTSRMLGTIAAGLQKAYIASTAGYNSPDLDKVVSNPFKYNTDTKALEGMTPEQRGFARLIVARGGYEGAQGIIQGMDLIQKIKNNGVDSFILPGENNSWGRGVRTPNVSRDLLRYQKYNVGSNGLQEGGTVLYQESEATRFLNRYGGNQLQRTTETKGGITPGIVVVDANSFDFNNDEKAREHFGNLAYGMDTPNGHYSFATMHRGDEGQHVTLIRDDIREKAVGEWRKEQGQNYQRNANTNALWQRGEAVAKGSKLSYEAIQKLNPYDRAAYQIYASTTFASPLTAYSQIGVEDMPDNAKRAKTEDALNKIYSPSIEQVGKIGEAAKKGLDKGLKLHYVRDEDAVSILSGAGGGLINNNGAVYMSSDILPYDMQMRGLWGALKGMGISIQADKNGDIYSALQQAGMLDQDGRLMIGGRDISHGLGIVTESSLKSPDLKDALLSIEQAADENGMVPGADGKLVPYQDLMSDVLTQFALSGEISSVARVIDKKNESGKIGAQFMSHLIPTAQMVRHQRDTWKELDELANDPDKALAAVFPSDKGDATSRELHRLKKERDENPDNPLAARAFAQAMQNSSVQGRIRNFIESRKREMTAGNYFDVGKIDKDSRITQGFLGTSFIQRVLTAARASEENKDLSNVEVVQKTNAQLFKDAMNVADWKGVGLDGLSDEQKQKVAANALLTENMFAGFTEEELKELKDKNLLPADLEDNGFVFDPQSEEFKLGYHRDPSTKKDVMTRYNGAQLLRGLEKVKGKAFEGSDGKKHNRPYESMFRNTIAVNPNDWEYLASADEDGDAVKRFSGLYYSLLKSDADANAKMQEAALKYYSDKFADVQVRPVEGETPENAKANLIERMSRSLVSRAKMAQFSGQDSRVAQLGLTAEMLADPNNTTALAFYKGMMRSAQLYDYATTFEKKPLDILLTNEDFKATALGAEYGKGVNAVTEALNLGAEKYKEGKRQLLNDEDADENATVQDYIGDNYYVGKGGVTLDKSKMGRIDQFNLPSAFQANILTSILSRSGSQYNVDEEQTLRNYLINDEEHGLGFENAVGEAEKNYLKAKRGFFVDYYTGKRTGAISDEEMEEFHKLQLLAEEEREKYIEEHRTGNPDTMKVNGEVVKISKWAKDHNRAIGYTQGRNIDLFGMTNANIAKALSEGMYFENDAIAELTNLWTGAKAEQAQTLAPIENPKATNKSLAKASTPKKTTKKAPAKKKTKTATATTPSTTPAPAPAPAPVLPQPEPAQVTTGGLGIEQMPNMYTKVDGYQLLKSAQNLEAQGRTDEAEAIYEQAEDIIRATTVSGHTMSTLAGQDQFNTPIMAYGRLFGINSPEDAGTTSALRKNAGDMMESIVLNHLNGKSKKYHFVDPLDVFGTEDERKLTGEARVEADKKLRRKMAFNYFTPGQKYNGLTIAGNTNPAVENKENLRGMWDSLMVDENGNVRTVLEMKTMGLHRFQDMVEGRNTDRRYFDEHGVPYTYKIQGAGYAHAAGLDSYAVAMTGLTEKDRRELDKAKKNPNYVPQISPLSDDNFRVQEYKVSDLEIPDVDKNGNFIYEENNKGEKQLKMLRGVEALHALQSRNEQMLNGELAPDGLMHTDNRLLGARQAMIANRLRERDIVNVKDFIPISSPDELAALASSPTSALAIANGDAGTLITEILGKVSGMPMELEQRQAVGEIGKNLLSEANNFNANMRKEIFKNRDASSSQSFMSSTQAQIENATNMLNTLKSNESIKKILSEQPNTQGAELLSSMLKTLETSVGDMVDNRISAAIAKGTHDVENAQKAFEETIKGKDGTESQRKSFEDSQRKMKNLTDMAELLEASADEDGLTKEQREARKIGAENLQKQIDELTPLYQQANAATTKNGIDAIDEMIGRQIQSPQEAAEKKIQELVKKAYGQGGLLLDMFKQGGLTEESFKENMSRLFGTGWEGLSDENRSKLLSGDAKIEDLLGAGTGGLMGTIQGQYRDELFGKIASGRQARLRNANKTLRTNEARLAKKSMTPEELAEENRYLEQERIRDSLEQYRNTFGLSKDPEEQEQYINLVHRLLGDNADEMLAERVISGQATDEELAGLGGQYGMIDNYVEQMLRESKQKTARSVRQMNRAARRSSLAIDRKVATPEELAQEMREDKEWGIRDALSNARDKLSGVDDNALVELAKSYLGDDITRDGLNRFLDGSMSDEELAGLGGQYGSLGDYQRAMLMQQTRQKRMREMSMNRRDRSLRRTMAGKGMSPEEQAQIATEDMEQQMRENLEQRMTTFGANSPQFQRAIQSTLGEKATQEDAMAFLSGTATPEQMAAWGGDYAMLGNYGNYIQDRALMQREGAEMSLDQLMSEKRLMKMQQSPFANTWGMRIRMQAIQKAQKERNLNFRIRQARQQLRMLDGESLTGTGSAKPQPETAASAEARREEEKPKMSLGEAIANLPTEADDAYTGVVFKGKDASGLSKNQQAQLAVVDGFAKRVGVQVGIHDTLRAPDGGAINGMFDPTTNKIDLALDAEGNLITRTMGHEMMHYIRNNSEDDYKELMAFTKSTLQNTPGYDYEARVQEKLAQYNNGLPENQWITRDQAEEEIGAEAMIDMLNGKDVMNDLQKQKGSLGNAVSGRLGDYADVLHETGASLNNPEAQAMAAQSAQTVETLRAKFMQASMNASRKRQETMGPNQRRRYSRVDAQSAPLAAMRNVPTDRIMDILRSGTIAGASIGITDPREGYFNQYGDSTLMIPPEKIDPLQNPGVQLFSDHAYTGSFPRSHVRKYLSFEKYAEANKAINEKAASLGMKPLLADPEKINKRFNLTDILSGQRYIRPSDLTDSWRDRASFEQLYLREKGMSEKEIPESKYRDYENWIDSLLQPYLEDKIDSNSALKGRVRYENKLFPTGDAGIEKFYQDLSKANGGTLKGVARHFSSLDYVRQYQSLEDLTQDRNLFGHAATENFGGRFSEGWNSIKALLKKRNKDMPDVNGNDFIKNIAEMDEKQIQEKLLKDGISKGLFKTFKAKSDARKIFNIKEQMKQKGTPFAEGKLINRTGIAGMRMMVPASKVTPEMEELAAFRGVELVPFEGGDDKIRKMNGEAAAKYRFSRRDDESRKKQRPEWMNDKSNPFVYGDSIAVQYAKTGASNIRSISDESEKASSSVSRIGVAFTSLSQSAVTSISKIMKLGLHRWFRQLVQQSIQFVKQWDSAMTQIQTITMKTDEEMETFSQSTMQQAIDLKTSSSDVATIKADLYRQGLNDDEVNERTESIVKFSKVTGIKAADASKIVATALNTGLEDSASHAMDVLTALGDSAATTADQIQKGIQKAGSSAKVSGVSYEELATLMTIGTANTQLSGQQIGTSLQTIFSRMNRLEDSDYIADINGENVSVNDVESALKLVGISLRDDEGNFRGSFEVLKELAGVWQDLNDTQKSLVTNAMAGSRQSNIFQTLMEGMSEDGGAEMERLLGLAENSDGTTDSKYEIATKSLATSLTLLQTSWDAVVEAVMSSDFMSFLLDSLNQVSEFLQQIADLINNGQGLSVGLTAIGAAIAGIAAAVLLASGPIGWLVGIVAAVTGIGLLNSSYQGINTAATLKTNKQNAANRIENVQANTGRRETAIEKARSLNEQYNNLTTKEEKAVFETKYADEFNAAINDICLEIPDMVGAFENAKLGSNELAEALGNAAEKAKEQEVEEEKGQFVEAKADATTLASATKSLFESENKIISYMNGETGRKDGLASLQSWEDLTTMQGKKIATYALEDDATAETYFNTVKSLKDDGGNYLYYQVVDAYNKAHPEETVDATSLDSFKQVMNWINATNYDQMREEDYHDLFNVASYQTGDGGDTYYAELKKNYEFDTGKTQGNLSDEEYFHQMVDYYNDGSAKNGSEVLRTVADKNGMGNLMVRNQTTASAMITASEMLRKADYAMFGTSGEYPYYLAPLSIAKYESENPGSVYLNNQTGQYELQTGHAKYRWSFDENGRMVLYRKGNGDDSFSQVDNYSTLPYDEETMEIFGASAGEANKNVANIGSSVVDYLIENFMSNIDTEKLEDSGLTKSELKSAAWSRIKLAMEEQGYYDSSTGLWNINASNAALVGNAINDILYDPFIGGGVSEGIGSFLPYLSSGANLPYAIDTDLLGELFKNQQEDDKGYRYLNGQLGTDRKYRYKKNADGDIVFERSTDNGKTYEAVPLTQETAYEDDLKGIQKVDTEIITQKTLANNAVYQNLGANALQTTTDKGWYNIALAKEAINNADFSNVSSLDELMGVLDQEFTASNGYTYKLSDIIGSAQTTDVSGTASALYNWMNTEAGMQALATPEGQQFVKDAFNGMSPTNKYNVAAVEPLLKKMMNENLSVDEAQVSEENIPLIGLIKTWLGDETFAKWQAGSISSGDVLTSLYGKQIGASSNNVSTNEKAQEIIEGFAGTNTESANAAKTLREYSDNLADQKFWLDYWDQGVDTAVAREALGIDKTISHEAADVQVQALKDSLTDGRTELYNGIITALLAGDEANALDLIKGQTVTMDLIQTLIENGYTNLAQTLSTVVGATFDGNGNITLADVKGDVAGNMGTVLSDKTTKASISLANSEKKLEELKTAKKQRQHPIFGSNYYTTELDDQIADLETEIADQQSKVDLLKLADEYETNNTFGDSTSEVVSYIRSMAEGTSNVSEAQAALAGLRSSANDFSIDEDLANATVQAIIASSEDRSGSLRTVVGFMNTEKGKAWVRQNENYWGDVVGGTDQAINEAALAPLFAYLQENPNFSATDLESDYTYGGLMQLLASYLGDENYQLFKQGKLSLNNVKNLLYASGFSSDVGNGSNRENVANILSQLNSDDLSQQNSALESIRSYTASEADWEYYADLWSQGVTSDAVKEALGFSKNDSNEVVTNAIKNKRIEKDAERQQYYGEIFKAMKGYGLIGSSEQERTTAEVAAELRLSNEEGAADMAEFLESIDGTIDKDGNLIVSDIYSDQTNAETLLQDKISRAQVRRASLEQGTTEYEQADRQVRLLQAAQNISKDYMTYGDQASTISGYMQGLGGTAIERATALGNISSVVSEAADKQAYIDLWRMGVRTKTVKNELGISEDMDEETANAMLNAIEASQYAENKNIYEGLVNNYADSVMTDEQKKEFFTGNLDEDKIQWLRDEGFEDLATILSGVSGSFEDGNFVFSGISGDEKATGEAREDPLTYWTEKLNQAEKGTKEFEKEQAMVDGLELEQDIKDLNKYGENTEYVAETLGDLAKGGKNAANAISSLTSKVVDLRNQQWALNTIQKGWNKEAGETLGITEDQYKIMEQGGVLDNYLESLQEGLSDDVVTTLFDPLTEAIQQGIDDNTVTKDFVVKFNTYLDDGTLDTKEIQDLIQSTENEAVQTLLSSFGDTTVFSIVWETIEKEFGLDLKRVTSAKIGGKKKSGGGGGGGKSAAELLIDKQKKDKTLYEHMVKMVQYQQTKYQNADELGNYGLMIEKEIEVEKKRLPVIQQNIEKLKEQIATVAADSDDWYSLRDAILEAEEEYEEVNNTIDENIKKLEENQQAIYKLRTDLEDTVKEEIENRKQEETDMLSGSVSMQETILAAIKQRYQDEWDLIKKDIDKKKSALEEEKSLIDERLQKRKDAADEQEKYEELAEYKKQLALISMDSTRTKDAAELREKIAELEEEIGWDIAEAEAERQTEAIDDQINAYDDYVTEGDEKLEDFLNDANNFADEVNKVLKMTQEEMFNWMKTNVQDYVLSLNDAQLQMVKSWEDTYKQMYGIVDTYWNQINGVLTSKETFLNYMKNSSEYINASDEAKAQMIYNWEEAYDKWAAAQKKDADYSHSDDYGEGSYSLPYDTPHYDWNETLKEIASGNIQGYNATANAQLQALQGTTLQTGVTLTQTEAQQLKALLNAAYYVQTPSFSTVDTAGYGTNNNINIDEIQIVVNEASFADEDDYDAFALKVGDAFVKQLSKRGFTTANYSF